MMPGVQFNELFPRRYAIVSVTYRYEALFFLYPYVTATYGLVERLRSTPNGIAESTDSLPALGGGIVTGAPWKSQIELNYSYNFGIFRDPGGAPPTMGGGRRVYSLGEAVVRNDQPLMRFLMTFHRSTLSAPLAPVPLSLHLIFSLRHAGDDPCLTISLWSYFSDYQSARCKCHVPVCFLSPPEWRSTHRCCTASGYRCWV